jgi:hypothetical protein
MSSSAASYSILPEGFHRVRYYGFLGHRHRAEKLARCRELLRMPIPKPLGDQCQKGYREHYEELTGVSLETMPGLSQRADDHDRNDRKHHHTSVDLGHVMTTVSFFLRCTEALFLARRSHRSVVVAPLRTRYCSSAALLRRRSEARHQCRLRYRQSPAATRSRTFIPPPLTIGARSIPIAPPSCGRFRPTRF